MKRVEGRGVPLDRWAGLPPPLRSISCEPPPPSEEETRFRLPRPAVRIPGSVMNWVVDSADADALSVLQRANARRRPFLRLVRGFTGSGLCRVRI